ncbi:MAG TPA: hypothetical protein VMT51_05270 [Dongiaceae bacterium]|nr:hypothetical protein [Dongiaceae bacterium]
MLRKIPTIYLALDPFLSPRGKILHRFEEFADALAEAGAPCVWISEKTRLQLDEPWRRLGHGAPFIAESGSGVFLPEGYFNVKSGPTMRFGRFTCMPVAKPQPAAAEALEELASDTGIEVVTLRSLSPRELSQNTGLPAREAELMRQRDFDELFFFAGASDEETHKFAAEAKLRKLLVQPVGGFWSLSCGPDVARCVRDLGGLYDRSLRTHAVRAGVIVASGPSGDQTENRELHKAMRAACDRVYVLAEKMPELIADAEPDAIAEPGEDSTENTAIPQNEPSETSMAPRGRDRHSFHLHAPEVWERLLEAILHTR